LNRVRRALRRVALAGSGVTFGAIAILSLVAPAAVFAHYGLALTGPDAANELHAVFTGFWLGLAALLFTAARAPEDQRLGDPCERASARAS
jgi:hypothetical protein